MEPPERQTRDEAVLRAVHANELKVLGNFMLSQHAILQKTENAKAIADCATAVAAGVEIGDKLLEGLTFDQALAGAVQVTDLILPYLSEDIHSEPIFQIGDIVWRQMILLKALIRRCNLLLGKAETVAGKHDEMNYFIDEANVLLGRLVSCDYPQEAISMIEPVRDLIKRALNPPENISTLDERITSAKEAVDAQPDAIKGQLEGYFSRDVRNRKFE